MGRWDSALDARGSGGTTTHNPWTAGGTAARARGPKFLITKAGRIESRGEAKLQGGWSWWSTLGFLALCPLHVAGFCSPVPPHSALPDPQQPAGAGMAGL